jgi:hypothetical protein
MHIPRGSTAPAPTLVQRPRALGEAQYTQLPVQAFSQQTPSTQNLDRHSLAAAQRAPLGFRPQLPFTQVLPGAHSASVVQLTRHALPAQTNGAQVTGAPIRQVPLPSHTLIGISLPAAQLDALHSVPAA